MSDRKLCALFIDFENFYFSLTNLYEMTHQDAGEIVVGLIASQLEKLGSKLGEFVIRQAFADWGAFPGIKKELQRMGIRIVDVLSTAYKNSADIELSLSVLETIITRPEIEVVVVFAGDRDYMPVALRARERGRTLFFAGLEKSLSGDVKSLVGKNNYIYVYPSDALGSKNNAEKLVEVDTIRSSLNVEGLTPDEVKAAKAAILAFNQYKSRFGSVKVGVFLNEGLPKALPNLNHSQRKQIFNILVEKGIVMIEQRIPENPDPDFPSLPFTVFVINEDNEAVKTIRNSTSDASNNLREFVSEAALKTADDDGSVLGADLGNTVRILDPGFSPAKYGFSNLTEIIEQFPNILLYDGIKSGGDKKYKLVANRN